jgi:hypothetical protein
MALIRTERLVDADAPAAWQLVTDWPAQSRWIPLTTVFVDHWGPAGPGVGTRFTGRSRLGPVHFDDPMEVTEWQPPDGSTAGRCRVRKLGPWLTGWAEVEVRPAGDGALVRWTEQVRVRWVPGMADPAVGAVGSAFFARVLRRVAAELAGSRPGEAVADPGDAPV